MFELERAAFQVWLSKRQHHFDTSNVSNWDIAHFAVNDGQNGVVVSEWLQKKTWEESKNS